VKGFVAEVGYQVVVARLLAPHLEYLAAGVSTKALYNRNLQAATARQVPQ
jgi:hypothetical protein